MSGYDFYLDNPEWLSKLRGPNHLAAVRAANARPGPRDGDGQPVINPRSANVQIVCACDYRGGSCGRNLGGVWRTAHGVVLGYQVVWPDARDHIQAYKGQRRESSPPSPGDRYPDDLLANDEVILLDDANSISVSCIRHPHTIWPLDLVKVRRRLAQERLTGRRQRYGSKPSS